MPGIADILSGPQAGPGEEKKTNVWLARPPGYLDLPVQDSEAKLEEIVPTVVGLAPPDKQDLLAAVLGVYAITLRALEERNAIYCGVGWHPAPDGTTVSSSLVVSLQSNGDGVERNPRLVLGGLIQAAANANDTGQVDEVELDSGPVVFFERIRRLPRPELPGVVDQGGEVEVYQLEALVPNEKGTWIAAIEFSTPYVRHGPLFREMMVLMANSVTFTPPPGLEEEGSAGKNFRAILGGS